MKKEKTVRKSQNTPVLNDEISLLGKKVTAGLLVDLLSAYPRDAKVALQNFNAGTIVGVGITAITAANVTERINEFGSNDALLNDEGPINTVLLGFWDEGNMYIEDDPEVVSASATARKGEQ